jgi:PIN domain nuclease of toxin-antitoxin system
MEVGAPLLLDTCAAIWFAGDMPMAKVATETLNSSFATMTPVYLSPISAWEVGLLCSRGRMRFPIPPQIWFRRLSNVQGVALADLSPEVLVASSFLPGDPPRDPADRIIAATAREHGYVLMTRDRPLLDYAQQGHIQAIGC